jgi:transposase-like protein
MSDDIRTYLKTRRASVLLAIACEKKTAKVAERLMILSRENLARLKVQLDEIDYQMQKLTIGDEHDSVIRIQKGKTGSGMESHAQTRPNQRHRLSAARTLSVAAVMQMNEDEAREAFARIRWHEQDGKPFCGRCGGVELYVCKAEHRWKCKRCGYRFSVTSDTIFASHKLPLRDLLTAIAIFVNAGKGYSALQFSRDLDVQYKTAFDLSHKIREAVCA